jgi:hypothetical protein
VIAQWLTWLRQLVRREPVPPAPALELPAHAPTPTALGLTVQAPATEVAPPLGTLHFRGHRWLQVGPADARGIVTFVREVAVDGRAVQSELRVNAADLTFNGTTYTLNGRES